MMRGNWLLDKTDMVVGQGRSSDTPDACSFAEQALFWV